MRPFASNMAYIRREGNPKAQYDIFIKMAEEMSTQDGFSRRFEDCPHRLGYDFSSVVWAVVESFAYIEMKLLVVDDDTAFEALLLMFLRGRISALERIYIKHKAIFNRLNLTGLYCYLKGVGFNRYCDVVEVS